MSCFHIGVTGEFRTGNFLYLLIGRRSTLRPRHRPMKLYATGRLPNPDRIRIDLAQQSRRQPAIAT